jgi:uncharacterized protein YdhG (YjbR/CyaY superfamily)
MAVPDEGTLAVKRSKAVDDYIDTQPEPVRPILRKVRRIWHAATPKSGEAIKYDMPMITLDGKSLVYFAAWKHHIGMYPIPRGDAEFESLVGPYRSHKDTVKFVYEDAIPYEVIEHIAEYVVQHHLRS